MMNEMFDFAMLEQTGTVSRFQVSLYALTGQCAKEFRQQQQKFTVKKREIISNSGEIMLSHQVMKMRDRNYQIG